MNLFVIAALPRRLFLLDLVVVLSKSGHHMCQTCHTTQHMMVLCIKSCSSEQAKIPLNEDLLVINFRLSRTSHTARPLQ
jgi:hypothetical protein